LANLLGKLASPKRRFPRIISNSKNGEFNFLKNWVNGFFFIFFPKLFLPKG